MRRPRLDPSGTSRTPRASSSRAMETIRWVTDAALASAGETSVGTSRAAASSVSNSATRTPNKARNGISGRRRGGNGARFAARLCRRRRRRAHRTPGHRRETTSCPRHASRGDERSHSREPGASRRERQATKSGALCPLIGRRSARLTLSCMEVYLSPRAPARRAASHCEDAERRLDSLPRTTGRGRPLTRRRRQ